MITIKCPHCKKNIHVNSFSQSSCMYCGSIINQERKNDNNHLNMLINKCDKKLVAEEYTDAILLYDEAIDLYPNQSCLYWGRLLAKNFVVDDYALITKGVSLRKDSDYLLALYYANDEEKECINTLYNTSNQISKAIFPILIKNEKKLEHFFIEKQREYENEMNNLKKELKKQVLNLEEAERKMRNSIVDINVIVNSKKYGINEFINKIENMRIDIESKSEVNLEVLKLYKEQSNKYLEACKNEWKFISEINDSTAFKEYENAKNEQKQYEKEINNLLIQLNVLKEITKDFIDTVILIDSVVLNKCRVAKHELQNGSFVKAIECISENEFLEIINCYMHLKS